jgi:hypothetical protein
MAECLFADPVGDLGSPDNQVFCEQADAYLELVDAVTPLPIAEPSGKGWLLSLEDLWFQCAVKTVAALGPLCLTNMEGSFIGGMSGSPIVSADGAAIGVACCGAESGGDTPQGPNPSLVGNLPGWFLAECRRAKKGEQP